MSEFIETPANKSSISGRKLVYGVGINDADYVVQPTINGKQVWCVYYLRWRNMLERCYSERSLRINPTYVGCAVCDEWLSFSNFKEWMQKQNWKGMHLDKDIITLGNKVYSEENCCFISNELNNLLTYSAARAGKCPRGVSMQKQNGKYQANINFNGKREHLGCHDTPELASAAYIKAKVKAVLQTANEQTDKRVANGLRVHAYSFVNIIEVVK